MAEMTRCLSETVRLSHVRLIANGRVRCVHVARRKDASMQLSVGSSSGDYGESTCLQVSRQNCHLNHILSTCLIDDPVDSSSTRSKHDNPRALIQRIVFSHVSCNSK